MNKILIKITNKENQKEEYIYAPFNKQELISCLLMIDLIDLTNEELKLKEYNIKFVNDLNMSFLIQLNNKITIDDCDFVAKKLTNANKEDIQKLNVINFLYKEELNASKMIECLKYCENLEVINLNEDTDIKKNISVNHQLYSWYKNSKYISNKCRNLTVEELIDSISLEDFWDINYEKGYCIIDTCDKQEYESFGKSNLTNEILEEFKKMYSKNNEEKMKAKEKIGVFYIKVGQRAKMNYIESDIEIKKLLGTEIEMFFPIGNNICFFLKKEKQNKPNRSIVDFGVIKNIICDDFVIAQIDSDKNIEQMSYDIKYHLLKLFEYPEQFSMIENKVVSKLILK